MMLTLSLVAVLLYGMKSSGHEVVCSDVYKCVWGGGECECVSVCVFTANFFFFPRRRALLLEQPLLFALDIGLEYQV